MDAVKNQVEILTKRFPALRSCCTDIEVAGRQIVSSLNAGGQLFTCGNGGSAADAEHIVGELLKSFVLERPLSVELQDRFIAEFGETGAYLASHLESGLRATALTSHSSFCTAMANDKDWNLVFSQQLLALGREGDVLLAISTSGNSTNICHACRTARILGIHTIGLTGESGGQMNAICDTMVRVPERETHQVQELHLPVYHCLCLAVERYFFESSQRDKG